MTSCRGVRGAITVAENEVDSILAAARELMREVIARNEIDEQDVCSVLFTATTDLNAICPAAALRQMGWTRTALLCFQEMVVPDSLPMCVRVLVHWNTEKSIDEICHVYLRDARQLRPDLAGS